MGGSVSTNDKSSNSFWIILIQSTIFKFLVIWPDPTHWPTHPPTHPPNYTPTLGWRSLHRFQIFKQNWNISISSSAIEFWLIPGVPPWGVGGWVDGGGGFWGCAPHTCAHAHACTHAHAHARAYDIIGNSHGFPQWGQPFAWNYHVYHACMCVRVHACMCMCVWGTPQPTPHTHPPTPPTTPHTHPPTPPPPRAAWSRKHQIQ